MSSAAFSFLLHFIGACCCVVAGVEIRGGSLWWATLATAIGSVIFATLMARSMNLENEMATLPRWYRLVDWQKLEENPVLRDELTITQEMEKRP